MMFLQVRIHGPLSLRWFFRSPLLLHEALAGANSWSYCYAQGPVTYPLAMLLQVWIFHRSLFKGNDRAQVSLVPVSPTHRFCWYAAGSTMSTSPTQDERPSPPSRKRACSGALQLGPRKKPCIMLNFKPFDCELSTLHQDFSGPLSAPWVPFWQGSPCLLQRADTHHEWPTCYVWWYFGRWDLDGCVSCLASSR